MVWMKKIIVLFLMVVNTVSWKTAAQDNEGDMVGFSCSFIGRPTPLVIKMTKFASPSKHKKLKKLLLQGNSAEQYLAVVLYEALIDANKITLTTAERNTIEKLYRTNATVRICSGCTFLKNVSISELLNGNHNYQARKWAKRIANK